MAMALGQLASFEAFVTVLESYGLAQGKGAIALAISIAALEILSLPVLLRLSLGPLMRLLSLAAVLLVPLAWLLMTLLAYVSNLQLNNGGYFGAFLPQSFGWWIIPIILVYIICSGFALHILGLLGNDAKLPSKRSPGVTKR